MNTLTPTPTPTSITLSPQQAKGVDEVIQWYKNYKAYGEDSTPQVFRFFGYAGSGKTTLAIYIAELLGLRRIVYAAFTGKAALVMRKKGCKNAQTLHSLIYHPEEVDVLDEKGNPTGETEVAFTLNHEDSMLLEADLLIIDECSMVGKDLGEDVLSFGVPVLVLGDPAQLPPINGTGFFNSNNPEVMLTEIHRQALDNPIIRMSMDVRTGKGIRKGVYGQSRVISKKDLVHSIDFLAVDQVLCGTNKNRRMFNQMMRAAKGFTIPATPMEGEKLICLRNNKKKALLNGGMWKVVRPPSTDGKFFDIRLSSLDMDGHTANVSVPLEFFSSVDESTIPSSKRRQGDEFDWGDVITVHKAQGSQYVSGLIYNENYCFREHSLKWLYTGITRISDWLVLAI